MFFLRPGDLYPREKSIVRSYFPILHLLSESIEPLNPSSELYDPGPGVLTGDKFWGLLDLPIDLSHGPVLHNCWMELDNRLFILSRGRLPRVLFYSQIARGGSFFFHWEGGRTFLQNHRWVVILSWTWVTIDGFSESFSIYGLFRTRLC